jgi:hypothetical protein
MGKKQGLDVKLYKTKVKIMQKTGYKSYAENQG